MCVCVYNIPRLYVRYKRTNTMTNTHDLYIEKLLVFFLYVYVTTTKSILARIIFILRNPKAETSLCISRTILYYTSAHTDR